MLEKRWSRGRVIVDGGWLVEVCWMLRMQVVLHSAAFDLLSFCRIFCHGIARIDPNSELAPAQAGQRVVGVRLVI